MKGGRQRPALTQPEEFAETCRRQRETPTGGSRRAFGDRSQHRAHAEPTQFAAALQQALAEWCGSRQ